MGGGVLWGSYLIGFFRTMSQSSDSGKKPRQTTQPTLVGDLLDKYELEDKGGYITQEFQDYGYRLACEMGEENRKAMYIKMAKTVDRKVLEQARTFVLDAEGVRNKGKLFVWAVGRLKKGESLGSFEEE